MFRCCIQFYGDTVKLMALNQLAAGSPLRTLCLLIARQPADVFSNATTDSSLHDSMNVSQDSQQHTQVIYCYLVQTKWVIHVGIDLGFCSKL